MGRCCASCFAIGRPVTDHRYFCCREWCDSAPYSYEDGAFDPSPCPFAAQDPWGPEVSFEKRIVLMSSFIMPTTKRDFDTLQEGR